MKDWKPYTFNEAVECNPKISIKKGEIVENCEMEDIEPNYRFLYPRQGKLYKGSNAKFQNGDTVFARITPCLENGKIAQIRGLKKNRGIGSTEFFVFRGKKNISDNDYIFYLSKTNLVRDTAIISMTGASGRQRADIKSVKKINILLPPFRTQERIASILSAYDDLIEVNNQRIKLLEETARELYKEWFVRMRFPGYKKAKFVKGVPEGWEVKELKDFGKVITGKTPSTFVQEFYGGNIPFIKTPDMHGNMFILETEEHISDKGLNSQKSQTLPSGSIIVNCIGALSGAVSITTETSQTNQQIHSIKLTNTKNLEFLFFAISALREMIHMYGNTGSTMTHLSKGKFEKLHILFPKKDLILDYNEITFSMFEQIKTLVQQNTQLRQIRDRLLPRLISGKLEVKVNINSNETTAIS